MLVINKKGQALENFAVLIFMFVALAMISVTFSNQEKNEEKIGEYQIELLDSYTVAEGARLYIDKSAEYSAISALKETDYCVTKNKPVFLEDFEKKFEKFLASLPKENMGLSIGFSGIETSIKHPYKLYIGNDVLHGTTDRTLIVTNENKIESSRFVINTEVSPNFQFDLNCNNLNEFTDIMNLIDEEDFE